MNPRQRLACAVTVLASAVLLFPWHATAERHPELSPAKAAPAEQRGVGGLPFTGKAPEALAPLDSALEQIILRHGIPGASVAITRDGKLLFARGYGWSNYETKELATPQTLFGLASVSKCFTALAVLKLVEEGKLKLDQKAFEVLANLKPPPRSVVDPRLAQITIRQLLNHSGGWDREKSGDPVNWSFQVAQRLGVPMPIDEEQLIRFTLGVPLDFDPGSRSQYSNFGYIVLGQVVARASGKSYEEYVRTKVLKPMGIEGMQLHDHQGRYFKGEARRYNAGFLQALPAHNMPWTDASGGWSASAVDLARMLTALDGSRGGKPFLRADLVQEMVSPPPPPQQPRPDGSYFGLGWDNVAKLPAGYGYGKSGCWPGVRAMIKHRVDGINTVILSNAVVQLDPLDMRVAGDAIREAQEALARIKEWPKVDLFEEFR